ncbi:peptide chain release factor N(5)-glutamine methyltransferase [Microbulbifer sp. MLAF003]|uniref:peptide chain release factor N(5)-glutamine methyltransferase n=1 Tax=Microbulbifer sp. MLAF003 TaxID=3032582 RepID=UPI0024ADF818|nr:peptide chain release factor N(5)-glutamine methyltransferase [Microbulbifer sp. MLAF003]WHI52190.1 peptide chain release factor N(5)-glutamine methyltransferase [Microbulbifer sp. MLAF003]
MSSVKGNLARSVELTNSESARLDIEVLLAHILGRERIWLYTWPEYELTTAEQYEFDVLLVRRKNGEPVAHLTGEREFWSLTLKVDASTLIPRPDTELLVETALALCPQSTLRALDLGTGTGAIALALASEKPGWQIVAAEKSAAALALAESNRKRLGFGNVQVLESHWFAQLPPQHFSLIVSNPPYIDAADPHLVEGDVRFEPRSALVAKREGLADIELIAEQAGDFLDEDGWLLVEHGWQQAESVRKIFIAAGYRDVESRRDYSGWERITLGRK